MQRLSEKRNIDKPCETSGGGESMECVQERKMMPDIWFIYLPVQCDVMFVKPIYGEWNWWLKIFILELWHINRFSLTLK